jgi:hypothetical protein
VKYDCIVISPYDQWTDAANLNLHGGIMFHTLLTSKHGSLTWQVLSVGTFYGPGLG